MKRCLLTLASATCALSLCTTYAEVLRFGEATPLPFNVTGTADFTSSISMDDLELYFNVQSSNSMFVMKRTSPNDEFSSPIEVPTVTRLNHPELSRDDLALYGNFTGGVGGGIVVIRRSATDEPFDESNIETLINGPEVERWATISPDELEIYYTVGSDVDFSIQSARRPSLSEPFGPPVELPANINDGPSSAPELSADGLTLYFASARPGGFGAEDIWYSMRESTAEPWGDPINAGSEVNTAGLEWQPDISADGRTLYFSRVSDPSDYPDYDLWRAAVIPEPASAVLLGGSIVMIALKRRSLKRC